MNSPSSPSKLSLAVDTSSRALCLAIPRGAEIIFSRQDTSGLQQSERLFPLIEEGLRAAEIAIEEIENFFVVTGPGSFTGLRAGIASVQGLARSVGKKEFGVSTFDVLAYAANIINQPIGIILNASRGDVYFGVREVSENDEVNSSSGDLIISIDALPSKIRELNLTTCISTMPEIEFIHAPDFSLPEFILPEFILNDATTINLAEVLAGKSASISMDSTYKSALPYYLRLSDAEVNLK